MGYEQHIARANDENQISPIRRFRFIPKIRTDRLHTFLSERHEKRKDLQRLYI